MIEPNYYHNSNVDVIKALELLRGKEACKDFCIGNVMKYVIRYDKKNGIEDLKKAQTYINRLITLEEGEEDECGDNSEGCND